MSTIETQTYEFSLIGGDLSLDFSNTMGGRREPDPADLNEHLNSYDDLVAWARQAQIVDEAQAQRLLAAAAAQPEEAAATFKRARTLREAIYNLFAALVEQRSPDSAQLATLNRELAEAGRRLRLLPTEQGFSRAWPREADRLEAMLWPIAWSAGDLLTGEELHKVRECANDTCGWLFVDRSRNHSRQWCDMKDCGNRAKAKRHYHRKKVVPASR